MAEWFSRNSRAVAILCNLSAVILAVLALVVFLAPHGVGLGGALAPAVGSKFNFSHNGLAHSRYVLYLAISTNCKVCEREADSYRILEESPDVVQDASILYLMPQDKTTGNIFLNKHGLRSAAQFETPFPGTGIHGFPTIVLVDRDNVVQFSQVGSLSDEDRHKLANVLLPRPVASESASGQVYSGR